MATETRLKVDLRHLLLTIQGLGTMLRDTIQEREESSTPNELLPWLGGELERAATEAFRLADESRIESREAPTEPPIWCPNGRFCGLSPGHEGPCQGG